MWNVWGDTSLFLITTNPIVNAAGELVMGRGIAKEFKSRFPEGPKIFARTLQAYKDLQAGHNVGMVRNEQIFGKQQCGWFMTKDHWYNEARLDIIERSVSELNTMAPMFLSIDLNFPGIGNGRLDRKDVLPIIERLPNNVRVWECV